MNATAAKVLGSKPVVLALGVTVGAAVLYLVAREIFDDAKEAADKFNAGTAYDSKDAGVVGTALRTLGNATNQATGGWLDDLGGWLGRTFYDLTHAEYDPNK